MLAVGGGLISQLPGVLSVKTDAKKFESTSAVSSFVSVSIPFGFIKAGIGSLMVVYGAHVTPELIRISFNF